MMEAAPETRVIILTASTEEDAAADDVTSYLRKETDRERSLSAVRDVAQGELPIPVDVGRRTFSSIRGYAETEYEDVLTKREREMLISLHRVRPALRLLRRAASSRSLFGTLSRASSRNWTWGRCRDWCAGQSGTGYRMTDRSGCLRGNGAWPVGTPR